MDNSTPAANPGRSQPTQAPEAGDNLHPALPRTPNPQNVTATLRPSSVRIRRLPSSQNVRRGPALGDRNTLAQDNGEESTGRRRSMSAPQPVESDMIFGTNLERPRTTTYHMPALAEEGIAPGQTTAEPVGATGTARRPFVLWRRSPTAPAIPVYEYDSDVVDFLDVIDPEVGTLTTLNNVQNSLFVPDLGRFINRRPTYDLSRHAERRFEPDTRKINNKDRLSRTDASIKEAAPDWPLKDGDSIPVAVRVPTRTGSVSTRRASRSTRRASISSVLTSSHFAVLPHNFKLDDGWSDQDKLELDDHVRHLLHSRRAKLKRSLKGFGQYVRKPLGFLVTLYGFLITVFGLVWVLLLIGWISTGGSEARHKYIINIVDNVLVALFAIVGDGLAPFRAIDTYHMCFIANYAHRTWSLRKKRALPKLQNRNDLPSETADDVDIELGTKQKHELSVLNPIQQKRLEHHQKKFSRSHTFYKPHETETHYAFSVRLLIAIVVLLDCHSLFQIALGACTWGINYKHRSAILTTVILCCSITCNVTAGILISIGDRRSRKKDVVERMYRQTLTEEAVKKLEKRKQKSQTYDGT